MRLLTKQFLTVLFSFSLPLHADEVEVRSGEHADFTRLVFYTRDISDFDVRASTDGFLFSLESGRQGFDLSTVFSFIPRSRILDIEEIGTDRLLIKSNCDCDANAFLVNNDIVSLDVSDAEPIGNSLDTPAFVKFELSSPKAPNESAFLSARFSDTLNEKQNSNGAGYQSADQLEEIISSLVKQDWLISQIQSANFPNSEPVTLRSTPGLRLQTSQEAEDAQDECLARNEFSVSRWLPPMGEQFVIGFEHSLSNEKKPAETDLFHVAARYIALGFGAEAINLLRELPTSSLERYFLYDVARVLDRPFHGNRQKLPSQLACDNSAALWSFLSLASNDFTFTDTHYPAILREFAMLPAHLRAYLGPKLEERLLGLGKLDSAAFVRTAYEHASLSVVAKQAIRSGDAPEAEETYPMELVAADHSEAEAIKKFLAEAHHEKRSMQIDDIERIEAFLHTIKGSSKHSEIIGLYVDSLVVSDDIVRAIDFVTRMSLSSLSNKDEVAQYVLFVVDEILNVDDDLTFFSLAKRMMNGNAAPLVGNDARDEMAIRLLLSGGGAFAADLSVEPRRGTAAEALFQAVKAIDGAEYEEAIARVSGMSDAAARRIAARAFMGLRNYNEAAEIFLEIGDTERAGELFWMARNWARAAEFLPASARQSLAERLATGVEQNPFLSGDAGADTAELSGAELIRYGREALRSAETLRGDIRAILEEDALSN